MFSCPFLVLGTSFDGCWDLGRVNHFMNALTLKVVTQPVDARPRGHSTVCVFLFSRLRFLLGETMVHNL
jgi:hypothetical protein